MSPLETYRERLRSSGRYGFSGQRPHPDDPAAQRTGRGAREFCQGHSALPRSSSPASSPLSVTSEKGTATGAFCAPVAEKGYK